jgi:hypothetical protein
MRLLILGMLLAAVAQAVVQTNGQPTWEVVDVGRVGDLALRLTVLKTATLAAEEWIGLEIGNEGDEPVGVRNAQYSIEATWTDPRTGLPSARCLASGTTLSMFPEAWKTTPVSHFLIRPGVHRLLGELSNCCSAGLGLAPEGGLVVEAHLHLTLNLDEEREYSTPPDGVPFTFEWRHPDPAGFEAMRARLRWLLNEPCSVRDVYHESRVRVFEMLLRMPGVGDALTAEELLAGLAGRAYGRGALVNEIACRFGRDPRVIEYYATRLRAGSDDVVTDLAGEHGIWDPAFVKPLLEYFEQSQDYAERYTGSSMYAALAALSAHRGDWPAELHIPTRLSSRILAQSPTLRRDSGGLKGDELTVRWIRDARVLALTHDPGVIPLLRPFLDRSDPIADIRSISFPRLEPRYVPALRVCDVALEAILAIDPTLGADRAVCAEGTNANPPSIEDLERGVNAMRDAMIADLKLRLGSK